MCQRVQSLWKTISITSESVLTLYGLLFYSCCFRKLFVFFTVLILLFSQQSINVPFCYFRLGRNAHGIRQTQQEVIQVIYFVNMQQSEVAFSLVISDSQEKFSFSCNHESKAIDYVKPIFCMFLELPQDLVPIFKHSLNCYQYSY